MNAQAFKTLEFDPLRALVRRYAQTDTGRARIDALAPIDDYEQLSSELCAAGEMIELRARGTRLSFEGIADPTESIARLKIAGTALDPLAMLDLARLCERAVDARAAIVAERETSPTLFEIVAQLSTDLKKLAGALQKKILPSGELDDRASPQLASIRRDLANARSRITRSLENLMRRASEAIQEELVTVRNDRFVIPVRADHQSRIKGVAHGSSSSGATVFIEPLETIEANNELQNLREAEQREIAEILFGLSEELRRHFPGIELAAAAITKLDFVNAKAAFAERFDCVAPEVSVPAAVSEPGAVATGSWRSLDSKELLDPVATAPGSDTRAPGSDTTLEFINARHPLLEQSLRASGGDLVPVSFKLDSDHPVMVISGANAGGKTIVLKTAGLLSLMALSGLPVPAKEARVPFYRSILADIGDQQSIAANLSTFTSHVANIAGMIESCETPALVMLDEVGTGTDPEEGSALGVAVVDHFKQKGAHVLATTHYSGLKMYAANEPGVLNASVEFDEKTLQPTYRLQVGLAGSSSGLEIARRFGIPNDLIKNAASNLKQSSLDAIEYLRRIKSEAEEAASLRKALEEERAAVAEKFAMLDREFQKRESDRQSEFKADLARSISEFEKLSRDLISQIEDRTARVKVEREAEKRANELKREAQKAAAAMSQAARSQTPKQPKSETQNLPAKLRGVKVVRDGKVVNDQVEKFAADSFAVERAARTKGQDARAQERDFKVGDRVRLLSFGSIGTIDQLKDDDANVRVGSLHLREKTSNLELIDEASNRATSGSRRKSSPTLREGSLEELRRRSTTTELHLQPRDSDSKSHNLTELNLIGKTTDEAAEMVDKFLDQAFLNGQTEVRIIHGHGTGALRRSIAELLADHPHVARCAIAPQEQGGSGAMIVELKS